MESVAAPQDYASASECNAAIAALTDPDLVRLKQIAKLRAVGVPGMTWEDLFSEAVARTLDGDRMWPKTVPLVAFLAQTMRSIASDERRRGGKSGVILESDLHSHEDEKDVRLDDLAIDSVTPERDLAARQALRTIERHFGGDPVVLAILEGAAAGFSPAEIQARSAMSETEYASAQRRIRRNVARLF